MKTLNAFDEPPGRPGITYFVPPAEFPFLTTPPGDTSLLSFLPEDWLEEAWAGLDPEEAEPSVLGPETGESTQAGARETAPEASDPGERTVAEIEARLAVIDERLLVLNVEMDKDCIEAIGLARKNLKAARAQIRLVRGSWRDRLQEASDSTLDYCEDLARDLRVLERMSERLAEFGTCLEAGCDRALETLYAVPEETRPTFSPGTESGNAAPPAGAVLPSKKPTNDRGGR